MATSKVVWFAAGNDQKWFETQKAAEAYEQQQAIIETIVVTGLNEDAAKKVAKALLDAFILTAKVIVTP